MQLGHNGCPGGLLNYLAPYQYNQELYALTTGIYQVLTTDNIESAFSNIPDMLGEMMLQTNPVAFVSFN